MSSRAAPDLVCRSINGANSNSSKMASQKPNCTARSVSFTTHNLRVTLTVLEKKRIYRWKKMFLELSNRSVENDIPRIYFAAHNVTLLHSFLAITYPTWIFRAAVILLLRFDNGCQRTKWFTQNQQKNKELHYEERPRWTLDLEILFNLRSIYHDLFIIKFVWCCGQHMISFIFTFLTG